MEREQIQDSESKTHHDLFIYPLLQKIARTPIDYLDHANYNCITGDDIRNAREYCNLPKHNSDDYVPRRIKTLKSQIQGMEKLNKIQGKSVCNSLDSAKQELETKLKSMEAANVETT